MVTAKELQHWCASHPVAAPALLPELVRRLIVASVQPGDLARLRVPSGDDIGQSGFDGVVERTGGGGRWVPAGVSVWEMGTGEPRAKAGGDLAKRTKDHLYVVPAESTFVFVTPRVWADKATWLSKARGGDGGAWGSISVIDATDLELWLYERPAVARWLAAKMGLPVVGLLTPEEALAMVAARYGVTAPPELFIAGRDVGELQRHLMADGGAVRVFGETPDEALAVAVAAMLLHPQRESLTNRALHVQTLEAAETVAGRDRMILLADDPAVADRLRLRGNSLVVEAAQAGPSTRPGSNAILLRRARRAALRDGLIAAGLDGGAADRTARDSRGSLTAALWLAGDDGGRHTPPWAVGDEAYNLVPMLLVGRIDFGNASERSAAAESFALSEAALRSSVERWRHPAGPLVRHGDVAGWVAAPYCWRQLMPRLDGTRLAQFRDLCVRVLGADDATLDLPHTERLTASLFRSEPVPSKTLRTGLCESLVLLSVFAEGADPHGAFDGAAWAESIVGELLDGGGNPRRWRLLADHLPLLAEAAPDAFLSSLEALLDGGGASALWDQDEPMFGGSTHVSLLFALENLAWSPQHLPRTARALARTSKSERPTRVSNSPVGSLVNILMPWKPSTAASCDVRIDALDGLADAEPDVTFDVCLRLLPCDHQIAHSTSRPRWRDWADGEADVPRAEVIRSIRKIFSIVLEHVGVDAERWCRLIEQSLGVLRFPDLHCRFAERVEATDWSRMDDHAKARVRDAAAEVVEHHSEYPDSDWALDAEQLAPLAAVAERLRPDDPREKHRRLFDQAAMHRGRADEEDWRERLERLAAERRDAAAEVLAWAGVGGLLTWSGGVESVDAAGAAVASVGLTDADEARVLRQLGGAGRASGDSQADAKKRVLSAFVLARYRLGGDVWLDRAVGVWPANDAGRGQYLAALFGSLPASGALWDRLDKASAEGAALYWRTEDVGFWNTAAADVQRAAARLSAAGRPLAAIVLLERWWSLGRAENRPEFPIKLALDLLKVENASVEEARRVGANHLASAVDSLITALEEEGGVGHDEIATLEWTWFDLLRHQRRHFAALRRLLARSPEHFVQVLELVYRADAGSDSPEPQEAASDNGFSRGFELLSKLDVVPGVVADANQDVEGAAAGASTASDPISGEIPLPLGEVNAAELDEWAVRVLELARERGRSRPCSSEVGKLLAHAPRDETAWPHRAVRDVLERRGDQRMLDGFCHGLLGRRGAHWVDETGGADEALAQRFEQHAAATAARWPRVAATLRVIARHFRGEARRNISHAEIQEFS